MSRSLIGAQMYTLRDHCRTVPEIARSCARVKAMGYDGIQASALGPIEPAELKRILDGEGLACAATHVSFNDIQTKPEAIVEQHRVLECRYPAIGGFHPREGSTREAWAGFARDFRAAGDRLAQDGLTLGYHNHSHELAPFGELTPLELLVSELGPNNWFEIDTYWIAHGGGDPRAWIERVSGRIPCVHFKDMTITPERQQKMCEIGSGNLNWSGIIESCRSAGVEWYLVERDAGDMDPFDSLEVSLNNMREMGL